MRYESLYDEGQPERGDPLNDLHDAQRHLTRAADRFTDLADEDGTFPALTQMLAAQTRHILVLAADHVGVDPDLPDADTGAGPMTGVPFGRGLPRLHRRLLRRRMAPRAPL